MTILAAKTPTARDIVPTWYPALRIASEKDEPPRWQPLDRVGRYRFWQPNDHDTTCAIVVDIDRDDWFLPVMQTLAEHPALRPSWIIERTGNHHGQIGWIIEAVATGNNAHKAPRRFLRSVTTALTTAFLGDPCFSNARCWNPTWTGWDTAGQVWWGPTEPRSLGTLRAALVAADLWHPSTGRQRPTVTRDASAGRNCYVFDAARLRASGSVAQAASAANDSLPDPLSASELRGIVRSIERWEARHGAPWTRRAGGTMTPDEIERQRERGRKGRAVNSAAQQQQAAAAMAAGPAAAAVIRSAEATGRAATIRALADSGMSKSQIMDRLGVSKDTVRRALRRTMEQ